MENTDLIGEDFYQIEKQKGNILDVNSAMAFKIAWDYAIGYHKNKVKIIELELLKYKELEKKVREISDNINTKQSISYCVMEHFKII
jgi:hypothetical protein